MAELLGGRLAHGEPRPELDPGPDREPDERRDRRVHARRAVQRLLQVGVDALERRVVPVEAAARLGRAHDHGEQDRLEEGAVVTAVREDPRRRVAAQLVDRRPGIRQIGEPVGARLDGVADEGAVLEQA